MISRKKIKQITDYILRISPADQTEALVFKSNLGLTRFANNQIHQNLVRENFSVSVRVVLGQKIGVGSASLAIDAESRWASNPTKEALAQLVKRTVEATKYQKPDPDFKTLPGPQKYSSVAAFSQQTAAFSPHQRAVEVQKVIRLASEGHLKAFGVFQTGLNEVAVANSLGIFAYHPETFSNLNVTMKKGGQSGYAAFNTGDVSTIKTEEVARQARQKVALSKRMIEVPKGEYEVVLEEAAVNEMMLYLAYLGFGSRAYHEGRSFLSGKLCSRVLGENITLWDDALNSAGFPVPFDFEGVAKKKVVLIEKGVARAVVYDHYHAQKQGVEPTGHGLPAPNTSDALAGHLHFEPGGETQEELVCKIKNGLLITRFWYVNAHHHNLVLTGMTRDGTFLIRNGEIVAPVHNLRFTQSIPEALRRVTGISKELKVEKSWAGANLVPALRIAGFRFTGVSKL